MEELLGTPNLIGIFNGSRMFLSQMKIMVPQLDGMELYSEHLMEA
jgi:hypothetical protein